MFTVLKVQASFLLAHLMRAAEVKNAIELMMGNLESYASDSVTAIVIDGSSAVHVATENENHFLSQFKHFLPKNAQRNILFQAKLNDISSPITSKNFRADVLRENTEAVFAACDSAHGRWAKLLGVRALLHPKLRLQEFLNIYNITQDFITATEKIGGRLGYSIRGTLQSQSKSFVDFQHESRMTKLKAILDQETWVTVDVPEEFQAIVASLHFHEESFQNSHNEELTVSSNKENRLDSAPNQNADGSSVEAGRTTSQTIVYGGVGYHMVNCGLILLKMLSEYVDISKCLPALSSEVIHRVAEILKMFNTRTCQLVLGAGAMQGLFGRQHCPCITF
ncbi:vacuolar protein sorting-associated protein 54, chloroplastic-like [Phalaenopsis equestris]|uniref:vacuolar protein sorting-associated protein 54, chloroplastic-like n=1 Tax=Phalaenopsis equestris TaxID=78828 RepID=UPI0009E5EE1E|nr:vacuolar protein sorting-associated protein 54, chloroplastic-like [Phalaenopsis equestris]